MRWLFRSVLIAVIALLVLGAFQWRAVLNALGEFLYSSPAPEHADLVLVLAGDFWGPRVIKGADLTLAGYAPVALFSGTPHQGPRDPFQAIAFLAQKGYPTGTFQSFDHRAQSTIEEAIVLRPELEKRGVKSVLLVTSAYHSRRAGIVFRLFCPGIRFQSIGAPDNVYHPENWWEYPNSKRLFFSEWTKIFGTILWAYPKYRMLELFHTDGQNQ